MDTLTQEDREHLRALSIVHYIYAAFLALFGLMGLGFMALGLLIPQLATGPNAPPPQVFTILFGFMGAFFLLFYGAHSAAIIVAGRYLQQRRRWLYCVIVASLDCMSFPFGTALGVCTFLVLARPTVQAAFRGSPLPPVAPPSLPTAPLGA